MLAPDRWHSTAKKIGRLLTRSTDVMSTLVVHDVSMALYTNPEEAAMSDDATRKAYDQVGGGNPHTLGTPEGRARAAAASVGARIVPTPEVIARRRWDAGLEAGYAAHEAEVVSLRGIEAELVLEALQTRLEELALVLRNDAGDYDEDDLIEALRKERALERIAESIGSQITAIKEA